MHKNSEVLKVESLETQLLSKYFKDCQRNITSLAGKTFSRRTLLLLFFGWEDYVPELKEIGLDPAVQGVPVKKKPSV